MRIIVHLTLDGTNETQLEGDAAVFDGRIDYTKGYDKRLASIGMWLSNWRYAGHSGPNNRSRVFIPWTSLLMAVTLEAEDDKSIARAHGK